MSERLPQIIQAVDQMVPTLDNPKATMEVPNLTQEELEEVVGLYKNEYQIRGVAKDSRGNYFLHMGGFSNA